jgi:hypothetical protein
MEDRGQKKVIFNWSLFPLPDSLFPTPHFPTQALIYNNQPNRLEISVWLLTMGCK